jgi:hypothetical protein
MRSTAGADGSLFDHLARAAAAIATNAARQNT